MQTGLEMGGDIERLTGAYRPPYCCRAAVVQRPGGSRPVAGTAGACDHDALLVELPGHARLRGQHPWCADVPAAGGPVSAARPAVCEHPELWPVPDAG